jgi:hypothetical protein
VKQSSDRFPKARGVNSPRAIAARKRACGIPKICAQARGGSPFHCHLALIVGDYRLPMLAA